MDHGRVAGVRRRSVAVQPREVGRADRRAVRGTGEACASSVGPETDDVPTAPLRLSARQRSAGRAGPGPRRLGPTLRADGAVQHRHPKPTRRHPQGIGKAPEERDCAGAAPGIVIASSSTATPSAPASWNRDRRTLRAVPSGRVFISYRREDTSATAGRLYDRLVAQFGSGNIFMDVDSITPGYDFAKAIETAVASCQVVLAVIGKGWLDASDERGRRLDDPDDFVALEIKAGLEREIPVIPVLVGGVPVPRRDELPTALSALARRQSLRLDHDSFNADFARLATALEQTFPLEDTIPRPVATPSPTKLRLPRAGGRTKPTHRRGGCWARSRGATSSTRRRSAPTCR
jgi:hypothetical protein